MTDKKQPQFGTGYIMRPEHKQVQDDANKRARKILDDLAISHIEKYKKYFDNAVTYGTSHPEILNISNPETGNTNKANSGPFRVERGDS